MMKSMIKSVALLYLLLLLSFTAVMIVVHMIPHSAIEPQFKRSVSPIVPTLIILLMQLCATIAIVATLT